MLAYKVSCPPHSSNPDPSPSLKRFECSLSPKKRSIYHGSTHYFDGISLIKDHPELILQENLCNLASLINFLYTGANYQVVTDLSYGKQMCSEEKKLFLPTVENETLLFCVFDEHSHTPRKVTFSLNDPHQCISYELI